MNHPADLFLYFVEKAQFPSILGIQTATLSRIKPLSTEGIYHANFSH